MPDELIPRKPTQLEQVERQGERMRDESEFDNLKADIRMSKKGGLLMPWSVGRPLRSAGTNPRTGEPITPLASLDLNKLVTEGERSSIGRELDRVVLHDAVSEGVLDQAERQGVPLEVTDQWWEVDEQAKSDEAVVADSLAQDAALPTSAEPALVGGLVPGVCRNCHGTGKKSAAGPECEANKCHMCNGTGKE